MDNVYESESTQRIAGDGSPKISVETSVLDPPIPDSNVKKVIIAVHGIGDQHSFATLQSVVNQFFRFSGESTAIPLGNFHTANEVFSIQPPYPAKQFHDMAFAEVYWAPIPRKVVTDQHTIEGAKTWANTIVDRLRLRWKDEIRKAEEEGKAYDADCKEDDFIRLKLIFSEMIQTISVLERLFFLSDRAGLFTFDLGKLLNDYLGDVQIVTEFGLQRREILKTFNDILDKVHKKYTNAEIHIIAHSEGTVVSFLGLLDAISKPEEASWIRNVKSLMTIGSPLDKHLILWPELFESKMNPAQFAGDNRIEWHNYYDHGDPIGFELDDTRMWIIKHQLDRVFDFKPEYDHGFSRYPFPGKAHIDYWEDDAVFGHYIQNVIKKGKPVSQPDPKKKTDFSKPPTDNNLNIVLSYSLPYLFVAALLYLGVHILYKAVFGYIDPKGLLYNRVYID